MIKSRLYWTWEIVLIALMLLGAWIYQDFIILVLERNASLNLFIFSSMLFSVFICLWRTWQLENENIDLTKFFQIYTKTQDPIQAAQTVSNSPTSLAKVLRLLGQINGSYDNRIEQAALAGEIEEVKESFEKFCDLPQFMSGFMIALGLFGTFIGLLETLQSTADVISNVTVKGSDIESTINGLMKGIQGPLAGMGTAFSASLFGLLGSLIVGLMVNTIRSFSNRIIHASRELTTEIATIEFKKVSQNEYFSPDQVLQIMGQLATFEKNAFDLYVRSRSTDLETSRELQLTAIQLRQVSDQFSLLISSFESVSLALQEQTQQMKLMTRVLDKQTQLSTAVMMTQDTLNRGIYEITELTANIKELAITTTNVQRNSASANRELQVLAQTVTDATVSLENGVQLTKSSNLILQRDINKLYSTLNNISIEIAQLGPLLTPPSSSQTNEVSPVVKSIEDLSLKLEKLFITYQVCFESALRESRQTHSS